MSELEPETWTRKYTRTDETGALYFRSCMLFLSFVTYTHPRDSCGLTPLTEFTSLALNHHVREGEFRIL